MKAVELKITHKDHNLSCLTGALDHSPGRDMSRRTRFHGTFPDRGKTFLTGKRAPIDGLCGRDRLGLLSSPRPGTRLVRNRKRRNR